MKRADPTDPMLPFGTNYCKCASCGEYFSNANNFTMHRVSGKCVPPAELLSDSGEARLVKNERGYWVRPGRSPIAEESKEERL